MSITPDFLINECRFVMKDVKDLNLKSAKGPLVTSVLESFV